ncbi:MAG: gamma-glutamyl-gamma-aminobutyrate hydrolase family protein, partial [Gemmatimonadales bacterium]
GTLWQDLAHDRPGTEKHDYFPKKGFSRDHLAHAVEVQQGTRLCEVLDQRRSVMVNSMHHQGVRDLGGGMVAAAVAPDGLVEAAELQQGSGFAVGVQWHPEMFVSGEAGVGHLFEEFVAEARERRENAEERSGRDDRR